MIIKNPSNFSVLQDYSPKRSNVEILGHHMDMLPLLKDWSLSDMNDSYCCTEFLVKLESRF